MENDQNCRRITPASQVSKFWVTQLMMLTLSMMHDADAYVFSAPSHSLESPFVYRKTPYYVIKKDWFGNFMFTLESPCEWLDTSTNETKGIYRKCVDMHSKEVVRKWQGMCTKVKKVKMYNGPRRPERELACELDKHCRAILTSDCIPNRGQTHR